jgi:hypothetical protein
LVQRVDPTLEALDALHQRHEDAVDIFERALEPGEFVVSEAGAFFQPLDAFVQSSHVFGCPVGIGKR